VSDLKAENDTLKQLLEEQRRTNKHLAKADKRQGFSIVRVILLLILIGVILFCIL